MGEDTSSDNIIFFELVIFLKYLVIKKLTWSSTTRFWTNNKHYHRSFVTRPLRENKNQNILILLIIGMNIALRNTIQTAMPIIYQNFFKKKKEVDLIGKFECYHFFFSSSKSAMLKCVGCGQACVVMTPAVLYQLLVEAWVTGRVTPKTGPTLSLADVLLLIWTPWAILYSPCSLESFQ